MSNEDYLENNEDYLENNEDYLENNEDYLENNEDYLENNEDYLENNEDYYSDDDPMEFQDYKNKRTHIGMSYDLIRIPNDYDSSNIPEQNIQDERGNIQDERGNIRRQSPLPCYYNYITTPETTKYDQLEKDMLKSKYELCTCFYKIRGKIKDELWNLHLVYSNGSSRPINMARNDYILYTSSSLDLDKIRKEFLKQIDRNMYDKDKSIRILNNTFDVYKDELKNLHDQWLKYYNTFVNEENTLYESYKATYQNVNRLQYRYMIWISLRDDYDYERNCGYPFENLIHPLELKLLKNYYNIVLVPKE